MGTLKKSDLINNRVVRVTSKRIEEWDATTNRVREKKKRCYSEKMSAAETAEEKEKISVSGLLRVFWVNGFNVSPEAWRPSRRVAGHTAGNLSVANKPILYLYVHTLVDIRSTHVPCVAVCFAFHPSTDLLQDWAHCSISLLRTKLFICWSSFFYMLVFFFVKPTQSSLCLQLEFILVNSFILVVIVTACKTSGRI